MSKVNQVLTKDGVTYSINDKRLPNPSLEEAGKVLGIDSEGNYALISGGSPTPEAPQKGDIIYFAGHRFRVLSADGYNCKVFCLDILSSNWYDSSPSAEQKVDFDDGTTGIKYEGSNLDTFCEDTFFDSLPADVQAAITEEEAFQDLLKTSGVNEGEEDLLITGGTFGMTYRIKKLNTESISVGYRHVHNLSYAELLAYFSEGSTTPVEITNNELNEFCFDFNGSVSAFAWLCDANADGAFYASDVNGNIGDINYGYYDSPYLARPAFLIDLSQINWGK